MLRPLTLAPDQPLQRQLYEKLRALIVEGRLHPGLRMPSTRMMADRHAVSRITVVLVYERLVADGYLETVPAKGTFVAQSPIPRSPQSPPPSPRREEVGGAGGHGEGPVGSPDPSLFPAGRWYALMRSALSRLGAQVRSEHPAGNLVLRQAIAAWLSASRGLSVCPDRVMLLNGRQQALHVVAHLALRPGARAVVEDPCDADAAAALAGEVATLTRVPVDAEGLRVDLLPEGEAALIHVTPEHQRPLGVTLAPARRAALLAWAERSGALVLEEDCEGELRYDKTMWPPLMGMDTNERVILLGGFGTSLGPWVGLAYLALPRRLVAPALAARRLIDDGRRTLEESALAELLSSGGYARHLYRLGKTYAGRRDALLGALRRHFGPAATSNGHAGLRLAWFPSAEIGPPPRLAALARRSGLEAAAEPASQGAILLGFGSLSRLQIETRVAQFALLAQTIGPVNGMGLDRADGLELASLNSR